MGAAAARGAGGGSSGLGQWLAAGGVALVLAGIGIGWLLSERSLRASYPPTAGRVVLPGLEAPAELLRDRAGVPHVFAASELDAWRGLGLVHAQDRLAQMVRLRRAALGASAEQDGEGALAADRLARTLGFGASAEREWAGLGADTRAVLTAYAEGVNAHLALLRAGSIHRPRGLDTQPEPWLPAHSLAVLRHHAYALGGSVEESLVLSALVSRLGGQAAEPFFPDAVGIRAFPPAAKESLAGTRPAARAPVASLSERLPLAGVSARPPVAAPSARPSPVGFPTGPSPSDFAGPAVEAPVMRGAPDVAPLRRAAGLRGATVGSSAFLQRGPEGSTLLTADLHAEPTLPAVFYQAHLKGGRLDAAGATLPGVPGFFVGFNADMAWAVVHAPVVVTDLVQETIDEAGERYREGGRWRELEIHEEVIPVRGRAEPDRLRVRRTVRGPLLGDLLDPPRALSVRWPGGVAGSSARSLIDLARAGSVHAGRAALRSWIEPVSLVVLADAHGDAGVQLAGFVPARQSPTGAMPVPARDRAVAWEHPRPPSSLPYEAFSGGRPVVAADGALRGVRAARFEVLWRPGVRESRIRERLAERPADPAAIQVDVVCPLGRELVARALELAEPLDALPHEAREVADLLAGWDGQSSAGSPGAGLFHAFLERLLRSLLEPLLGPDLLARYLALRGVDRTRLALRVLDAREDGRLAPSGQASEWDEGVSAERVVRRALREAWISTVVRLGTNREKWVWGRLHRLTFRPLAPEAFGRRASALAGLAYGGDGATVQVAGFAGPGSFDTNVVAAFRLRADTGDLAQAMSVLAPGQSEHPGHPQSADAIADWMTGHTRLLSRSRAVVSDGALARLELEPSG